MAGPHDGARPKTKTVQVRSLAPSAVDRVAGWRRGPLLRSPLFTRSTSGHPPLVGTHIALPAPQVRSTDSADGDVVVLHATPRDLAVFRLADRPSHRPRTAIRGFAKTLQKGWPVVTYAPR